MRRLVPLAAGIALLGIGAAVLIGDDPGAPSSAAHPAGALAEAKGLPSAGALEEPARGVPEAGADVARAAVTPEEGAVEVAEEGAPAEAVLPSLAPGAGLRIEIVRAADEAPLPRAELLVVDTGRTNEMALGVAMTARRDIVEVIEQFAERYRADEQGVVVVPHPEGLVVLTARSGELSTFERLGQNVADRVRLELEPTPRVRVRVLGADGAPAADVPVALRLGAGGVLQDPISERTGADGIATLSHVDVFQKMGMGNAELAVAVAGVFTEEVSREISLEELPREVIDLRLPEHGEVLVEVRGLDGKPVAQPTLVTLAAAPVAERPGAEPSRPAPPPAVAVTEDGVARFRPVESGLRIKAQAGEGYLATGVRAEVTGAGPRRAGERITLVLEPDREAPLLTGRLLDQAGDPVAETMVDARLHTVNGGSRTDRNFPLLTDAGGRFVHSMADQDAYEGGTRRLTLRNGSEHAAAVPTAVADLSRVLHPGPNDLGDLVLAPPPVIVSGRVTDPEGQPVAGARVIVEHLHRFGSESGQKYWRSLRHTQRRSDAEGSFVVDGELERAVEYRLRVTHERFVERTVSFVQGQHGVVVVLGSASSLAGEVLLDEGIPAGEIVALLRVDTGPGAGGEKVFRTRLSEDGRFAWRDVAPGTGHFLLRAEQGTETLYEVEGLAFVAGQENEDPRVRLVDLRGQLLAVELRLVDDAGEAISQATVHVDHSGEDFWAWNGETTIVSRQPALDLSIHAPGYRHQELSGVRQDREVVLQRGLPMRVEIANGMPALPDGFALRVSLRPDSPNGWRRSSDAPFDATGVAEVRAGSAGPHAVFLAIERSGPGFRTTHHVSEGVTPDRCEVPEGGGGVLRLDVEHEDIRSAVQRMQGND